MFLIEFLCILLSEFGHLNVSNCEAILFDDIDDFSNIDVWIWFDHGEGLAFLSFELASGKLVCIIDDFQLSWVNI